MSNEPEKLQRNKAYPLADYHPLMSHRQLVSLGVNSFNAGSAPKLGAVWTGEKRPPKKGEWYLSGSPIEAYQAPNDLTTAYHIAKIVEVKTTTLETYSEVER